MVFDLFIVRIFICQSTSQLRQAQDSFLDTFAYPIKVVHGVNTPWRSHPFSAHYESMTRKIRWFCERGLAGEL
jgi:hypothetical protein